MKKKVEEIVMTILELDSIDDSINVSMTGIESWDSLKQINIVLALEDEFKLSFSDEEILRMTSLQEILHVMNTRVSNLPTA